MYKGTASSSAGPDAVADLQLPSLEGVERPSDVINAYMKGTLGRSTKLSDAVAKLDAIPVADRTDVVKRLLVILNRC